MPAVLTQGSQVLATLRPTDTKPLCRGRVCHFGCDQYRTAIDMDGFKPRPGHSLRQILRAGIQQFLYLLRIEIK